MAFNPLEQKGMPVEDQLRNWSELNVEPFDKNEVDPYTRCRVITMNGIEVEGILFSHQFARHTDDMDLRRDLAMSRRIEQQQQKAVNWLLPGNDSPLETTIGYEQVAVDLTAWLARNEPDPYFRKVLEFGLLEDFDHLYRYADLMDLLEGKKADRITGPVTEIMPGRPTVAEHRHPYDDVRRPLNAKPDTPGEMAGMVTGNGKADPVSLLHALTIVAAEQQTMNFYMNVGNMPKNPLARALYQEIAQIEEQHVTHYESMLDPKMTWFERLVSHEYNECYLYYSFMQQESDPRIKRIWELHLDMEIGQLHKAIELFEKYEKMMDPKALLPKELPEPVKFESNKEYIRKVLAEQINLTADLTEFVPIDALPEDHRYYRYQEQVNSGGFVPSEDVIKRHIGDQGEDYRSEPDGPHPVRQFQDRHEVPPELVSSGRR